MCMLLVVLWCVDWVIPVPGPFLWPSTCNTNDFYASHLSVPQTERQALWATVVALASRAALFEARVWEGRAGRLTLMAVSMIKVRPDCFQVWHSTVLTDDMWPLFLYSAL